MEETTSSPHEEGDDATNSLCGSNASLEAMHKYYDHQRSEEIKEEMEESASSPHGERNDATKGLCGSDASLKAMSKNYDHPT